MMRYFIDCEFDGHNGPLLTLAIVREDGASIHIEADVQAQDSWVMANVVPLFDYNHATTHPLVPASDVGEHALAFIGKDPEPIIVADSPVDIGRFCRAISTGPYGGWASVNYPVMRFEVHDVACYPTDLPGAVQHNAWWDAMALRHKLSAA